MGMKKYYVLHFPCMEYRPQCVQSVQKVWKHEENTLCTKLFTKFVQYIHPLS